MSDLGIRAASQADAETIVAFNVALARETEGKPLPTVVLRAGVLAALDDPSRGRYFLACDGQRVVGQLMLTTEWSDWRNGVLWWIQSVYVAPGFRRAGVFRRLYEHIRDVAQRDGNVVGIRLYVERNNTAAQDVYRKVGMIDAGYLVFEEVPLHGPEQ